MAQQKPTIVLVHGAFADASCWNGDRADCALPGGQQAAAGGRSAEAVPVGLARHDPIHVADMIKALPERGEDPDIKAWSMTPR